MDEIEYEQYDFGIELGDTTDDGLQHVKQAIRNEWMAPTREKITRIYRPDMQGDIVAIELREHAPTLGGYTDRLLHHGWAYFHYDNNTVYVGRLVNTDNGFRIRGRETSTTNNSSSTRIMNTSIPIEHDSNKQERHTKEVRRIITDEWETRHLDRVTEISCSTESVYIIWFESKTKNGVRSDNPTVPTKQAIEAFLHHGWGVTGIKTNMLFVSPIQTVVGNNKQYQFADEGVQAYRPLPCSKCGDKEYYSFYVVGEKENKFMAEPQPVNERMCKECFENDANAVTQETYKTTS